MGDYSVGHFNFTLKKDAPVEVIETLRKFVEGESFQIGDSKIYRGDSAYHHDKPLALIERCGGYGWDDTVLYRFVLTFQIKYGCAELASFAGWIAPHVVVNSGNKGFIGYSISEYSSTVTTFTVDRNGRLNDWKILP